MSAAAATIDRHALLETLRRLPAERRSIIAIAGAPGSGKSTLADWLVGRLNAEGEGTAGLLPMDGFHYDNWVLEALGRLQRKGAPDTFDVGGLHHMLMRLAENSEDHVAVPVFDRSIEIARAGARLIARTNRIIIAEGNYLLVGAEPWSALRPSFALTVLIDPPESVLEERLNQRWIVHGLSDEARRAKLVDNDLPNGRYVRTKSIAPDFRMGV